MGHSFIQKLTSMEIEKQKLTHSYVETHKRVIGKQCRSRSDATLWASDKGLHCIYHQLENVFEKHYAPNHMPDPQGEWSFKENNSELHYGIRSKVNQSIYTLVCNYMPNIRILAKAVLQIFCSQSCSYTKCLCLKKGNKPTKYFRNRCNS